MRGGPAAQHLFIRLSYAEVCLAGRSEGGWRAELAPYLAL